MDRQAILELLSENADRLRFQYDLRSLTLFGSVARGDEHAESDADFIVEFEGGPTHRRFFALKADLEQLLGRRVDLGTPKMLRPSYRGSIERESIRVA